MVGSRRRRPCPGGGPGDILDGYKVSGPNIKAFLLAGWRFKEEIGEQDVGFLEAFVWVDGMFYKGLMADPHPEASMLNAAESDIILLDDDLFYWEFPTAIAEAYNMPKGTLVVVYEPKDVSDFLVEFDPIGLDINYSLEGGDIGYRHLLRGNVRLTFLVPIKNK